MYSVTALIISILYVQVKGIHPNGTTHLSNLILNNPAPVNLEGNSFQSRMRQLAKNLPTNLENSENMKLAKSFHQALNMQQTNTQGGSTQQQQPSNSQQNKFQPSVSGQHTMVPQSLNSQSINVQQSMVPGQQTVNLSGMNMQQPTQSIQQQSLLGQLATNQQGISQSLNNQQAISQPSLSGQLATNIQGVNTPSSLNFQQSMLQPIITGQQTINPVGISMQQPLSLQQSMLQPTLSGQQPTNVAGVSVQQPLNLQQSMLQPILTGQITTNQGIIQQPQNFQQMTLQPSPIGQQAINLQGVNNQQHLNIQPAFTTQQVASQVLQQPVTLLQSTNTLQPNNLQNIVQPFNQNLENLQVLTQISDISPLSYLSSNPNSNPIVTVASSPISVCNANLPGETVSVTCPQNQQVLYYGVPSNAIDLSQVTNNVPATVLSSNSGTSQPPVVTILAAPQQNQQPYVVQNPTEPNPITIVRSVQPLSTVQSLGTQDQNQISLVSSPNQAQPTSYVDANPSLSSILASKFTNQSPKSSSLKTLLPLILNMIQERDGCGCKERDSCGCQKQRGFPENTIIPSKAATIQDAYSKPRKEEKIVDKNSKYVYDDSEEIDSFEGRRNSDRYKTAKKPKFDSAEYDYSEEYLED